MICYNKSNFPIKIFYLLKNIKVMKKNLTTIELFVIEAVKRKREELKMNPSKLALEIGLNRNFIRRIESKEFKEKYSLNHLNEIARVLQCRIADFFPLTYVEEDCIEEYHTLRDTRAQKK